MNPQPKAQKRVNVKKHISGFQFFSFFLKDRAVLQALRSLAAQTRTQEQALW
jgi:hypothetical protein